MPEQDDTLETPGLVHALRVLRERWWLIPACALVALVAAIVYVEGKPNQYTATASLQFTTNSIPSQVAGVSGGQSLDPEGEKNTDVQLVTTTPVAAAVIGALKLKTTPSELLGQVSASDPQNDYVVDVSVIDGNAKRAASIANAFAQEFVAYSQSQNEEALIKGQQLIAQHIASLPAADTTDRANLEALSQKLLLLQAVATANAKVASTAAVPESPSSPNRKATAAVALVFGLLLGVGLAFLLNLLSTRVRSWEEFEKLYGLRALAGIPVGGRAHTAAERDIELEPFRILHNSLSLLSAEGVKTVLVTSAVPGEGKTTVALGLARAAAQAGTDVVLVEADLRRPTFAQRMRVDGRARGLAQALFDGEDPLELLQSPFADLPRLRVLAAGQVPADAPSMLRPYELTRTFEALASATGLVVVDSAPLLPVADTRVLLDELSLDAELVVARLGVTTREDVRGARALLDHRGLRRTAGLVVNAIAARTGNYYYGYGAEESPAPAGGASHGVSRSRATSQAS
jgi:capsular exopolysaccharide synthesis family protein